MQPTQQPTPTQTPVTEPSMSLNKKRLFIAALLLLVLLTAVLVIRNNNPATNQQSNPAGLEEASQVGVVSITSNGFEPATITIKKGQSVEWTNNDDAQHQVASDPHPSDDALPGLNDDIPLEKEDTFTYVFEKAGTYTYHDELNPLKFNGTVVVEE